MMNRGTFFFYVAFLSMLVHRQGIDPSPRRSRPTWSDLLSVRVTTMLSCDFSAVDTVLLHGISVLLFIELDTRRVHLSGVMTNPVGEWLTHQVGHLTFVLPERFRPVTFLVRDWDTKVTTSLEEVLRSEGIRIIRAPIQALGPRPSSSVPSVPSAVSVSTGCSSMTVVSSNAS